jgi:hypothetical protein
MGSVVGEWTACLGDYIMGTRDAGVLKLAPEATDGAEGDTVTTEAVPKQGEQA